MSETAKIELDGKVYELPVVVGTENEKAIDISKLRDLTGYITLDTGYKNTGATKSAITFLDGEEGILHYRGYSIEQLAEKASFIEVAYLLIYGNLPTQTELDSFQDSICKHTLVHEDMKQFFEAYPSKAHPMGVLSSMVASLATFYPESLDPNRSPEAKNLTIHRLLAKLPTLAAWSYKNLIRHPFMYPRNEFDYCKNFMYMMFSMPTQDYHVDPVVIDALNKLLILHADHEQNCSTSTVRIVGSSQANLYSTVSAGISALWGPLHGGANQEVIEMLERIHADGGNVDKWVAKAKRSKGFFHVVEVGAPGVNEAFGVVHKDVLGLDAQAVVELDARHSSGACSRNHNFDLVDLLVGEFERVEQCSSADDGGTVLVVVHDGDVELFFEAALDFKGFRRFDVLEVDAAKCRGNGLHGLDEKLWVFGIYFDVKNVDVGENFEE